LQSLGVGTLLALAAALGGCGGLVALLPSGTAAVLASSSTTAAAAHVAGTAMANGAGPVALGLGGAVIGGPDDAESYMIGLSRANAETCAGFHGRTSERTAEGLEQWTYETASCRVALSFKEGYVSQVSYAEGSTGCAALLAQCRRRKR
jgi:hypothetical protein